jgi:hypothetical protein
LLGRVDDVRRLDTDGLDLTAGGGRVDDRHCGRGPSSDAVRVTVRDAIVDVVEAVEGDGRHGGQVIGDGVDELFRRFV